MFKEKQLLAKEEELIEEGKDYNLYFDDPDWYKYEQGNEERAR